MLINKSVGIGNLMKLRLMTVLCSILLLAACNQLSIENYDRLETGMNFEEVVNIIGKPDSCDEKFGTRSCIWGDPKGTNIKGKFLSDNAVFFSHNNLK